MDKKQTFEEMVIEEHKIKERSRQYESLHREATGENQYSRFCIWCNAFNEGQGKLNSKIFAKYLKEENIELNFWQKKYLAEKYFGFEYTYNYNKDKWLIKKKIA